MPDQYWLIVRGPRFDRLPFLKRTRLFQKYCEYDEIKEFVEQLRKDSPGWLISIGVTREKGIYILNHG